jgi:prolyl-tRNA synthetase
VKEGPVMETAEAVAASLEAAGYDVLLDDRDQRPGFKFKDADLIGFPLRVVVGERGLKEGKVEIKWRAEADPRTVPAETAAESIIVELKSAEEKLASKCQADRSKREAAKGS